MTIGYMALAILRKKLIYLTHLLEKCNEHDLRLSARKIQFKPSSVSFIGRSLANKRVLPDRSKVTAIIGMPTLADKAAVQRFLGMCLYLCK